jgi:beta-galactosidase
MSDSSDHSLSRRHFLHLSAAAISLPLADAGAVRPSKLTRPNYGRPGRDQAFDFDWRFHLGADDSLEGPDLDDSGWRTLDLPHDWSIEDLPPQEGAVRIGPFDKKSVGGTATGFTVGGEGWYRKHFRVDGLPAAGRVEVVFEGVYMECDAWLNGEHLGGQVHGYTPFSFDLTPHLRVADDNILAVRVRNFGKNSRWYAGSGIYRSVWLDVMPDAAHVARWGVGVVTRRIADGAAEIDIETRLTAAAAGLVLVTRVRNAEGAIVAEIRSAAAADRVHQSITLLSPQLWSPDTPVLYMLETGLRRGNHWLDRVSTPFGIRVVSFDTEHGMQINGAPMKLRGGCIHHDNGLLGSAAFPDAEERRVRLLKARGFNAVRSSHNPASSAFADACDRQGMLLIEEAFDMWRWPKNPQDYSTHFDQNWQADLTAMVLSARNHPSVIMWSIGNEIPNRSTPEGVELAWNLANEFHRLDSTRPVTAAINAFAGRPLIADESTAKKGFAGRPIESAAIFLDVMGYNYKHTQYAPDHARLPDRVMYGSESFPKDVFAIWSIVDAHSYVIGDFVWAAMDYLGEAGIGSTAWSDKKIGMPMFPTWPWVVSNTGDLDLLGRQKAQSLARDVVWGVSPLEIAVLRPMPPGMYEHVSVWGWSDEHQRWTWPGFEGQLLIVRVYTRGNKVELYINGKIMASKTLAANDPLPLEFQVPYAPGSLEVIAYGDGAEMGRRRFDTAGAPAAIELTPEHPTGLAQKSRLYFLWANLVDAQGRVVPDAVRKIELTIRGPAKLIGFGSAGTLARGSFQSAETETHDGRALAILKSDGTGGTIEVKARSDGLPMGSVHFHFA